MHYLKGQKGLKIHNKYIHYLSKQRDDQSINLDYG